MNGGGLTGGASSDAMQRGLQLGQGDSPARETMVGKEKWGHK